METANEVACYGLSKNDNSVLRVALDPEVSGKRKQGRPKKTWKKQVKKETVKIGLKDALNRAIWRDGVLAITVGMG